ncbi:unnamed protein product [Schistocephalus solidus]|uniref:G_PROTEIN_RECEP_F1_2 domain-containing protein n=1 Tax=Schistocephalus solidus TaxID=70667 RepID=A0A183SI19_SCHSO|nr:unnamed protein product [Schistocephalus solidus]
MQTWLQPFAIVLTLISNSLLAYTITRPAMRTPTNLLLLGIAMADLLTGLLPLPVYLLYFTNVFDKDLTVIKAYASYTLSVSLPTVFHTVSIWLTLLLAIQRFIYITMPLSIQRYQICKFGGVWSAFGFTILLAVIHHASAFLTTFEEGINLCYENAYQRTGIESNSSSSNELYSLQKHRVVTSQNVLLKCTPLPERTFFILLFLRVLTIHLGPSVFLCVLTAYMSYALHQIGKKREQLLMKKSKIGELVKALMRADQNIERRPSRKDTVGDAFKTSKIMLVVLGIFLSVEIPTTVFIVTYAIMIACKVPTPPGMSEVVIFVFGGLANLLITLSEISDLSTLTG